MEVDRYKSNCKLDCQDESLEVLRGKGSTVGNVPQLPKRVYSTTVAWYKGA